ncbi:DNA glycosylase [Parasponia andersonii]|uniref:DNA glycosylase n=1 Tax=Parasponia andersonii TaxID=3476 RepID=A0A2P5AQ34_PARAD|nr:DNA glycosylase [Parasponia andersonii]
MEVKKEERRRYGESDRQRQEWVSLELPLGDTAESFNLESVVCSHGLFMMAPNRWDPLSKTLFRPLQLTLFPTSDSDAVMVCVSQPQDRPRCLHLRVHTGTRSLTLENEEALLAQVWRMLRLSEYDERVAREFRELYGEEEEEGSVVGRVFRSPTLFEDMVKCMLLCNCRWPRTLSMAEALCDLQLELRPKSLLAVKTQDFTSKTPAGREVEPKKKLRNSKASKCLAVQFTVEAKAELEPHSNNISMVEVQLTSQDLSPSSLLSVPEDNGLCEQLCSADLDLLCDPQLSRDTGFDRIGNFPTPTELAKLDKNFLAKRCKLGYRAGRIVRLAKGIVEGRIQLRQLEETCMERSLSSYSKLAEKLRRIDGFGPFTCANVLMCMGYYHVIPTDSETIRHLKQVHARETTIRTMEKDVQKIYAEYAPFQFLAYWSEIWSFYEKRFGKLSEMPCSAYKLITASNMRTNPRKQNKRKKTA